MTDAYRDDLAHIHDVGFGGFAQAAAPVLMEALRGGGIDRGLVIDLGCGSGILSRAIYLAGYDVLGVEQAAGRSIDSGILGVWLAAALARVDFGIDDDDAGGVRYADLPRAPR